MKKKHQVHNLVILDESGSMESIKKTIISGFNEMVQTIKGMEKEFPDQEHFISFVSFNGLGQKLLHFVDPASKLEQLNSKTYQPDSWTPLYDAIGFSVNKLRQFLEGKKDYNVLVTILTDGEENSSREFSGSDIRKLIENMKEKNWTFTYIGTNHDIEKAARTLSIDNALEFDNDEASIEGMFAEEREARVLFANKLACGEEVGSGYFDKAKRDKNKKK